MKKIYRFVFLLDSLIAPLYRRYFILVRVKLITDWSALEINHHGVNVFTIEPVFVQK